MRIAALATPLCALAVALPAAAQEPQKYTCVPHEMVRCGADGKCETRQAGERDKRNTMVLDFAARRASVMEGDKEDAAGDIVDLKVESGTRRFVLRRIGGSGNDPPIAMTLDATGLLSWSRDDGRVRLTARCTAA